MAPLPLNGLKIVVTRPRDQAAQLARGIAQAGGSAILFPLLEISPVSDSKPLHELVARLGEFNLAIFISPNAVQYGIAAIREVNCEPLLPPCRGKGGMGVEKVKDSQVSTPSLTLPLHGGELKVATVGQGSAKALRELGIANAIAPSERFDSEALLALPELQNVHGWRVVIFRGNGGRELLGDTLKARGATVEYATCYQRSKPQQDIALLLDANADALTITSSEALTYLWDMLDDSARKRLADVPLFVPHERIAAAARSLGWHHVIPTAGGDEGLLADLIAWGKNRNA